MTKSNEPEQTTIITNEPEPNTAPDAALEQPPAELSEEELEQAAGGRVVFIASRDKYLL
jgi:hypothetical protein